MRMIIYTCIVIYANLILGKRRSSDVTQHFLKGHPLTLWGKIRVMRLEIESILPFHAQSILMSPSEHILLSVAIVHVIDPSGRKHGYRMFLDQGSQINIRRKFVEQVRIRWRAENLVISEVGESIR